MNIELTAATQRAIDEARQWGRGGAASMLEAPAVLLGLLAEPECRAAIALEREGVDADSVRKRWSALERMDPPEMGTRRFSPELEEAVASARQWLTDLPPPLILATEHLLLGLAAGGGEVGRWLRGRGIRPEELRDEILGQYGLTDSTMTVDAVPLPNVIEPDDPKTVQTSFEGEARWPEDQRGPVARKKRAEEPKLALWTPETPASVVRLLDAAANRGREALRVLEDYVRFVLDDRHLTEQLKRLRHGLTSALAATSMSHRLALRDTTTDVGTSVSTESERVRRSAGEVLTANFTRLQESLRSLEEFGKLDSPEVAQTIEQIRYESYTLQKAVHGTLEALDRLGEARLYVLVDGCSSADTLERLACSLVEVGVGIIQLREKRLTDRELLARARRLRSITAGSETLLVMNDRPDLAVLAGADGVHVGQDELTVRDVRQIVGPEMLVGVSTHDIQQARQAVLEGASYLGVGPVFPSDTKSFREFPGLELARQVAAEIQLPAFAIGGIGAENVGEVLSTGIGRVAVSGAIVSSADPARAARDLLEKLQAGAR